MTILKEHIEEYYPNGQVKMIIKYKGNWETGDFVVHAHVDYDEHGNIMKFKDQLERFDFLDKMHNKAINLENKDFSTYWECALTIRKLITVGALDVSIVDGYKWAIKHCTINGQKIEHYSKLKKGYENAKDRGNESIEEFEG